MVWRTTAGGQGGAARGGLTGPFPIDVWILVGAIFATFSLRFFAATAGLAELLTLSPAVWSGQVWRLASYPFAGTGSPGFWFLLELLVLVLFARTYFESLGRRRGWRELILAGGVAGLSALLVAAAGSFPSAFLLMQGQHLVLTVLIAAFATLHGRATILLFFVLPIEARWFLLLELVFAFLGFLASGDLPGFVGLAIAVGWTWWRLSDEGGGLRTLWLRIRHLWFRGRLAWMRKRRGFRVVRDDESVH